MLWPQLVGVRTMRDLTFDEACELRDRVVEFLHKARDFVPSFSISNRHDNYWRNTREASRRSKPGDFRPTVTFFCLEAQYAVIQAATGQDVRGDRSKWAGRAIAALRRLHTTPGTGLEKIRSTMSRRGPNVLSAAHLGMLIAKLENARRLSKDIPGLSERDWLFVHGYGRLVNNYLSERLDHVGLGEGDPEHPYLVYRTVECLRALGFNLARRRGSRDFCQRVAGHFNRLATGLAHGDATPADGIGLIFLWSSAGIAREIPVPDGRWEPALDRLLELSQPTGDWPLGHALGSGNEAVVPSGEVAGAFLNVLLTSDRWQNFPTSQAMKVLAHVRPLAERLMRTQRSFPLSGRKPIRGWTDPRLGSDTPHLQAWTTASHILLLSRLVFVLRKAIRSTVVSRFRGTEPRDLGGPGFATIAEVDTRAPVAGFVWDHFV